MSQSGLNPVRHGRHNPSGGCHEVALQMRFDLVFGLYNKAQTDCVTQSPRQHGIAVCRLTSADVVRHPLVARIVDAYDTPGASSNPARDDAKADTARRPARPSSARKTGQT